MSDNKQSKKKEGMCEEKKEGLMDNTSNETENKEGMGGKPEQGITERSQTITFAVSEKTKQVFELLLLLKGKEADDVFERMVYKLAAKVCGKAARGGCGKKRHGHGCGHGHGKWGKHGHGFCPDGMTEDGEDACGEGHRRGRKHGHGMGCGKAFGRIPLWSRRRRQFSHQILKAFFRTEKDGVALRDDMFNFFSVRNEGVTRAQFDGNLNNMGTEGGNSHGHVFDFVSGEVRLAAHIAERAQAFREKFVSDDE